MARLVTLAKELLAREPEMGRPTLATALGVTEYKARTVLAEIKKERDAEFKAELDDVLAGRITQNADGESGGTTDGRS